MKRTNAINVLAQDWGCKCTLQVESDNNNDDGGPTNDTAIPKQHWDQDRFADNKEANIPKEVIW